MFYKEGFLIGCGSGIGQVLEYSLGELVFGGVVELWDISLGRGRVIKIGREISESTAEDGFTTSDHGVGKGVRI